MANKTLTQALGSGAYEIGDLIRTGRQSNTTPGQVLLPADGSAVNAGTYPLLAAELDPGCSMSQWEIPFTTAGTGFCNNTQLNNVGAIAVSENDVIWIIDSGDDLQYQSLTATAEDLAAETGWGTIACSSDGTKMVAACNSANGTNDLKLYYVTSLGLPASGLNIETADIFSSTGKTYSIINRAGTSAKVIALNGTDTTYDTYSSGANIGTGWSLDFGYVYSSSPAVAAGPPAWSDDLDSIILSTLNGMWITTNGGSTWAEDVLLPNTPNTVYSVAVDEAATSNFYAIGPSATAGNHKVFKSSDAGANWTSVLDVNQALNLLQASMPTHLVLTSVDCDINNNVYVVGTLFDMGTVSTSVTFLTTIMFYSEDGGTTWTGTPMSSGKIHAAREYVTFLSDPSGVFLVKDGSQIYSFSEQTSSSTIIRSDLTTGKIAPVAYGHKIVADAV
jgi:hypothetical protein